MSLPKLRALDKFGVVTDVDAFDLPLGAWSFAKNVRFENGRVNSAPVWRSVSSLAAGPRFVYVSDAASETFVGHLDGSVRIWTPQAETDASVPGHTPSQTEAIWSGCTLSEVSYINREDRPLWAMAPSEAQFSVANEWDPQWRCKIIRAYNSSLCAFNITKGGIRYPTMVKTSDIVEAAGTQPTNWDHTSPTTNAIENPLTEMRGEIKDAQVLGDSMILYSTKETWQMRADGSDNVYSYRKLPFTGGAINTNCVVEVDNKHFVFGTDDIWMHDGLSKQSIISGRNRKFVFRTLMAKRASEFFVSHNPARKELSFNYVSGDQYVEFTGDGCNRAAVFNYENQSWTFDDLPLVFASGYTAVSLDSPTWEDLATPWDMLGGSWQDFEDGFKSVLLYVGGHASPVMYARDDFGDDSIITSPVDVAACKNGLLERLWMDLDELDVDLRGYKHILCVYPQGRLTTDSAPLWFSFGSSDYANINPAFSEPQDYDAGAKYKLDYQAGGRFLSMRIRYPDYKGMSLSGMDFEIEVTGER